MDYTLKKKDRKRGKKDLHVFGKFYELDMTRRAYRSMVAHAEVICPGHARLTDLKPPQEILFAVEGRREREGGREGRKRREGREKEEGGRDRGREGREKEEGGRDRGRE